jgi:DNA-binding winged helix-turn-helix (wHTH) protein/tetratricopeptide (TPR) repeat protein
MVSANQPEVLRFGVFELNLPAHELRKYGVRIRLNGQPFDLLCLFLERRGTVVTREEMQARLWPEDTFVDFERSLNTAIKKLRSALGDSPEHPLYIETIPRVGYRFIAPVSSPPLQEVAPEPPAPEHGAGPDSRTPIRRRLVLSASTVVVLFMAAGAWFRFGPSRAPALRETDRVVLADLRNATGDSTFESSLGPALRVGLSESPYLNLVGDADVRRLRPTAATITSDVARQACATIGAAAVIEGDISQSGAEFEVHLTAFRCAGGTIARAQQAARSREQILDALGAAARDLRIRLGEPEASAARFATPVGKATSSSFAALKAFSAGEQKRALGMDYETIPDYKLAADLDPDFALAYARLGSIYQNAQEWGLARLNYEHAFAIREHASERERLYIASHYYHSVTDELDKAAQVYELWRQVYPRDIVPPNNLATIYIRSGQLEKAVVAARDAVKIAPQNPFCQLNLMQALQRIGKYAEAKSVYEDAAAHRNDSLMMHLVRYSIAFGENEQTEMDAQLKWAKGNPREGELLDAAAWGAAAQGQLARARALFLEASRIGFHGGLKEYAALVLLDDAQIEADVGYSKLAARDVQEALEMAGDALMVQASAAVPLAQIGEETRAKALAAKATKAAPLDTMLQNVTLPTTQALSALEGKRPLEALQHLETVRPYDMCTDSILASLYYRGQTLSALGRYSDAAAEFRRLLDARLTVPNSPYLALAHFGLANAAHRAGNIDDARREFNIFFDVWKDADVNLPILRTARREYLQLAR